MFDLALRTEKARKRQKVYTVTEAASGANPYGDGPLKAACTICRIVPEALTPKQQRQWCQWLGELAEECGATVEELTAGILKIPEEDSGCKWDYDNRKYANPQQYKFRQDVMVQIARGRCIFEKPEPQPTVIRFGVPTYLGVTT